MSTTAKSNRKTKSKLPKGVELHAETVDRASKQRSYEIALEMAKKQRAKQSPK